MNKKSFLEKKVFSLTKIMKYMLKRPSFLLSSFFPLLKERKGKHFF